MIADADDVEPVAVSKVQSSSASWVPAVELSGEFLVEKQLCSLREDPAVRRCAACTAKQREPPCTSPASLCSSGSCWDAPNEG